MLVRPGRLIGNAQTQRFLSCLFFGILSVCAFPAMETPRCPSSTLPFPILMSFAEQERHSSGRLHSLRVARDLASYIMHAAPAGKQGIAASLAGFRRFLRENRAGLATR